MHIATQSQPDQSDDIRLKRFIEALETGFRLERNETAQTLAIMRHVAEVRKTNPDAQLMVPETGQIIEFVEPSTLIKASDFVEGMKIKLLDHLKECKTKEEASAEIFTALQTAFHAHVYMGQPSVGQQFLCAAFEHTLRVYSERAAPKRKLPKTLHQAGALDSINDPTVDYWKKTIHDMVSYVDLCIDASDDLVDLATIHLDTLHAKGEFTNVDGMVTPFHLGAFYRQQAIEGKPVHDIGSMNLDLDKEQSAAFADQVARILQAKIYGPFTPGLPYSVNAEMAWFIGRAAEVIQEREKQPSQANDGKTSYLELTDKAPKHVVLTGANDAENASYDIPPSFTKHARRTPIVAANDNYRSIEEILKDPASRAEICEKIGEIFTQPKYVNTSKSIPTLLAAKTEFAQTHKLKQGVSEEGPSRY